MYELATEKLTSILNMSLFSTVKLERKMLQWVICCRGMWGHFKPQKFYLKVICMEIKDKKTGLSFTVSYGVSDLHIMQKR
jgi:hypothetical protein